MENYQENVTPDFNSQLLDSLLFKKEHNYNLAEKSAVNFYSQNPFERLIQHLQEDIQKNPQEAYKKLIAFFNDVLTCYCTLDYEEVEYEKTLTENPEDRNTSGQEKYQQLIEQFLQLKGAYEKNPAQFEKAFLKKFNDYIKAKHFDGSEFFYKNGKNQENFINPEALNQFFLELCDVFHLGVAETFRREIVSFFSDSNSGSSNVTPGIEKQIKQTLLYAQDGNFYLFILTSLKNIQAIKKLIKINKKKIEPKKAYETILKKYVCIINQASQKLAEKKTALQDKNLEENAQHISTSVIINVNTPHSLPVFLQKIRKDLHKHQDYINKIKPFLKTHTKLIKQQGLLTFCYNFLKNSKNNNKEVAQAILYAIYKNCTDSEADPAHPLCKQALTLLSTDIKTLTDDLFYEDIEEKCQGLKLNFPSQSINNDKNKWVSLIKFISENNKTKVEKAYEIHKKILAYFSGFKQSNTHINNPENYLPTLRENNDTAKVANRASQTISCLFCKTLEKTLEKLRDYTKNLEGEWATDHDRNMRLTAATQLKATLENTLKKYSPQYSLNKENPPPVLIEDIMTVFNTCHEITRNDAVGNTLKIITQDTLWDFLKKLTLFHYSLLENILNAEVIKSQKTVTATGFYKTLYKDANRILTAYALTHYTQATKTFPLSLYHGLFGDRQKLGDRQKSMTALCDQLIACETAQDYVDFFNQARKILVRLNEKDAHCFDNLYKETILKLYFEVVRYHVLNNTNLRLDFSAGQLNLIYNFAGSIVHKKNKTYSHYMGALLKKIETTKALNQTHPLLKTKETTIAYPLSSGNLIAGREREKKIKLFKDTLEKTLINNYLADLVISTNRFELKLHDLGVIAAGIGGLVGAVGSFIPGAGPVAQIIGHGIMKGGIIADKEIAVQNAKKMARHTHYLSKENPQLKQLSENYAPLTCWQYLSQSLAHQVTDVYEDQIAEMKGDDIKRFAHFCHKRMVEGLLNTKAYEKDKDTFTLQEYLVSFIWRGKKGLSIFSRFKKDTYHKEGDNSWSPVTSFQDMVCNIGVVLENNKKDKQADNHLDNKENNHSLPQPDTSPENSMRCYAPLGALTRVMPSSASNQEKTGKINVYGYSRSEFFSKKKIRKKLGLEKIMPNNSNNNETSYEAKLGKSVYIPLPSATYDTTTFNTNYSKKL